MTLASKLLCKILSTCAGMDMPFNDSKIFSGVSSESLKSEPLSF